MTTPTAQTPNVTPQAPVEATPAAPSASVPTQQPPIQSAPSGAPVHQESDDTNWQQAFTDQQQAASPSQPPPSGPQGPVADGTSQPQQPVEPAAPANPIYETAQQLGIQVPEGATIDQVAEASLRALQQAQPYAQYGQALMPHAEQINQALQAQGQQPQAPESPGEPEWNPSDYFRERWETPEWKPQYDDMINKGVVRRDENTGDYVAAPGYEAMVAAVLPSINAATEAQNRQWRSFMRSNPYEQMYESLLEPLKKQWQADMDARMEKYQQTSTEQSYVQNWEAENSTWLYDQSGNFTERGKQFAEAYQEVLDSGVQDRQKALGMAARMVPPQEPQQQPAPQATVTQPAPQQQPPAQQQANEASQSFFDSALQRAQQQPSNNGHYVAQNDDPPQSAVELENLFSASFNAQRAQQPAA